MKWPFVSRAHHEALLRSERANTDSWQQALHTECERRALIWQDRMALQERYDALLEKYHALRVSGANAPAPIGLPPAQRPAKPADEAIETVVARFGGNSRLRRQLQKYVYTQRLQSVDEAQIAKSVTDWRDPESDEESA